MPARTAEQLSRSILDVYQTLANTKGIVAPIDNVEFLKALATVTVSVISQQGIVNQPAVVNAFMKAVRIGLKHVNQRPDPPSWTPPRP